MSRMPYPDPARLSEAKRAYVEEMGPRMLNVVRMALHTPDGLWERQRDLSAGSVRLSTLPPVLREVLVLCVGFRSNSDYVLYHHLSIARNLGMSEETLRALESGEYGDLAGQEQAIARFAHEVVLDAGCSDVTLASVKAYHSDADIFEMLTLIGNYMMTARMAAVSGCDLDGSAIAGWAWDKRAK